MLYFRKSLSDSFAMRKAAIFLITSSATMAIIKKATIVTIMVKIIVIIIFKFNNKFNIIFCLTMQQKKQVKHTQNLIVTICNIFLRAI